MFVSSSIVVRNTCIRERHTVSIPLPTVNLAGVTVNQSGVVSFANTGVSAGGVSANPVNTQNAGTVLIYNESGSGLLISFTVSQSGFYLPAGAWQPVPIKAGETGYTWTVIYNLPSPPVTLLLTTYYFPGEKIPPQPTLGNSPIGIGGTIVTSSVQTLSNETFASRQLVIDMGLNSATNLVLFYNTGEYSHAVLQAGVAHTVITAQASGNPLLLGQSGDTVQVVGNFSINNSLVVGAISAPGTLTVHGSSSLDNTLATTDGNGNLTVASVSNANGKILGWQSLATPYLFENNVTLNIGTTGVVVTGVGGIPSNATFVAVACAGVSSVNGYVQMGPGGATFSGLTTYPILFLEQVNGNTCVGSAIIPVNTATNKIDMKVANFNITSFSASVYAYLA